MKNLIAYFLAFLVLFSSSFIVIDEHYCCGKLESFSIFGEADKCDMAMPSCNQESQNLSISEKSCCLDVKNIKSADVFKQFKAFDIEINNQDLLVSTDLIPQFFLKRIENSSSLFNEYSPPLISRNILVLVQCFRI